MYTQCKIYVIFHAECLTGAIPFVIYNSEMIDDEPAALIYIEKNIFIYTTCEHEWHIMEQ